MPFIRTLLLLILFPITIHAQTLSFGNPSFEGTPKPDVTPAPWNICGGTPDTQPGQYGVTYPPFHGISYIGLQNIATQGEGCTQKLSSPMTAGSSYTFYLRIRGGNYLATPTPCQLCFYGGFASCDVTQLLWQSAPAAVTTIAWQLFALTFTPTANYNQITFYSCGTAGSVHIDSLSYIKPTVVALESINFSTHVVNNVVNLKAAVFSDQWCNYTVERSIDGVGFEEIVNETPISKDIIDKHYQINYSDPNPLKGTSYYRIKLSDNQDQQVYSATKHAWVPYVGVDGEAAVVYANGELQLRFYAPLPECSIATLSNIQGNIIQQGIVIPTSRNAGKFTSGELSTGIYLLSITSADGEVAYQQKLFVP